MGLTPSKEILLAELELGVILQDTIVAQQGQVLSCMGKTLGYCRLSEQAIKQLPLHILYVGSDLVEPLVVGVARHMVAF